MAKRDYEKIARINKIKYPHIKATAYWTGNMTISHQENDTKVQS